MSFDCFLYQLWFGLIKVVVKILLFSLQILHMNFYSNT